jgi:hypothetical protein
MKPALVLGTALCLVGCSSDDSSSGGGSGGTSTGGTGNGGSGGNGTGGTGTGGSTGNGGTGADGGTGGGSTGGTGGGSASWDAGNPDGSCSKTLPPEAQPADVSNPTSVVGTGDAASCTFAALQAAVGAGGVITFDCGASPVTIAVAETLQVPIDKSTVIDGGQLVTLDGQSQVRILSFDSPNWQALDHRLTLQHIALKNGKATPTEAIPPAPAPCSQGFNDGQGGAVYMRDGNLSVIDCIFENNHAAPLGPDTGGGAIYVEGSKNGLVIEGSTFRDNQASNAGAVGGLFCEHHIYNSLFEDNAAVGHDANNNDPNQCDAINNGQNQTGSGGNGGAIYSDGIDVDFYLCGDKIVNNAAGDNAFGGGLFFTSNNYAGTLSIIDTTITGNTGGHWTNAQTGSNDDAGTAVGTNCHELVIENSTIQGLN